MAISQYWVGQIPSRPIAIDVRDSSGNEMNLSAYTEFNVVMLDADNNKVDLTGSSLSISGASTGRFVFRFPTNRSLFTEAGDYLLQMEIKGASGTRDYTTGHHIRVHTLGGTK